MRVYYYFVTIEPAGIIPMLKTEARAETVSDVSARALFGNFCLLFPFCREFNFTRMWGSIKLMLPSTDCLKGLHNVLAEFAAGRSGRASGYDELTLLKRAYVESAFKTVGSVLQSDVRKKHYAGAKH